MHVHQTQCLEHRAFTDIKVRTAAQALTSETEVGGLPFRAAELHDATDVEVQVVTGKASVVELRGVSR